MRYYIFYFACLLLVARISIWFVDLDEKKKNEQRKKDAEIEEKEPMMFVDNTGELLDLKEMEF